MNGHVLAEAVLSANLGLQPRLIQLLQINDAIPFHTTIHEREGLVKVAEPTDQHPRQVQHGADDDAKQFLLHLVLPWGSRAAAGTLPPLLALPSRRPTTGPGNCCSPTSRGHTAPWRKLDTLRAPSIDIIHRRARKRLWCSQQS